MEQVTSYKQETPSGVTVRGYGEVAQPFSTLVGEVLFTC